MSMGEEVKAIVLAAVLAIAVHTSGGGGSDLAESLKVAVLDDPVTLGYQNVLERQSSMFDLEPSISYNPEL